MDLQRLINEEHFGDKIVLLLGLLADDVGMGEEVVKHLHVPLVETYEKLFVYFLFKAVLYPFFGSSKYVGVAKVGSPLHF